MKELPKEIREETEKLIAKVMMLDREILLSGLPLKITLEEWKNDRIHITDELKKSEIVTDYIKIILQTYEDIRRVHNVIQKASQVNT